MPRVNILEAAILKGMLTKNGFGKLTPIVSEDMLDTTASRRLLNIIRDYYKNNSDELNTAALRLLLHATFRTQVSFRDDIEEIIDTMDEIEDMNGVTLNMVARKFSARSMSMKAIEHIAAHIDDDDYDPAVPCGMLTQASELGNRMSGEDDVDYATALPPDQNVRNNVMGLGFSTNFDHYLDGGYGPGELVIYVSISGVGKTSMLLKSAAHAAKQGKHVLYISREISKHKCVQRLDQCLTNFDKSDLVAKAQTVLAARSRLPGRVTINDWSHRHATVADIRAKLLKKISEGTPVDVLFVDYMELISPEVFNINHPRLNHTGVAIALRALGAEFGIPVVTAWQAKRAAINKQYLEKDDLGEDWNVVKTADIIIGLNQNPEELRDKTMRVNIIKQRESTNRSVMHLYADLDTMRIREASLEDDEEVLYGTDSSDGKASDIGYDKEQAKVDPEWESCCNPS